MARGGARNRSGQGADPTSARSDARGYKLTALPSEGFDGDVPPIPFDAYTGRELALWDDLWTTPQACAWSMQSWRWDQVADLVRMKVRSEADDASVGVYAALRALRADLGLTPAGLKENGWAIAVDAVAAKRDEHEEQPTTPASTSSRGKLKVVASRGA